MTTRTDFTFAQEILYVLHADDNNTGLRAQQARELTGAILQQLRVSLRRVCTVGARGSDLYSPMVCRDVEEIIAALDLSRPMLDEPQHAWEPRTDAASWLDVFERNVALADELQRTKHDLLRLQQDHARFLGLGPDNE